jgi:hypothetical protein
MGGRNIKGQFYKHCKSQNRNCSGLLEQNKMLGTAQSWNGLEKCEIKG